MAHPPWHVANLFSPPHGHTQGCHHSPKACLPGQTPGSKISLNSFHLISGAMLAFPPGKLTALYITSQNPDHTLTAHIWIWGSPCTPLIRCLDTTMHGKQKNSKTRIRRLFRKMKFQKQKNQKKCIRCTDGLHTWGWHHPIRAPRHVCQARPQDPKFPLTVFI